MVLGQLSRAIYYYMNSNALEAKPKIITLYDFFNYVLSNKYDNYCSFFLISFRVFLRACNKLPSFGKNNKLLRINVFLKATLFFFKISFSNLKKD